MTSSHDESEGGSKQSACPSESAHDYVVERMHAGKDLQCYYTVRCCRCGDLQSGYVDEIPPARFEQSDGDAEELLET